MGAVVQAEILAATSGRDRCHTSPDARAGRRQRLARITRTTSKELTLWRPRSRPRPCNCGRLCGPRTCSSCSWKPSRSPSRARTRSSSGSRRPLSTPPIWASSWPAQMSRRRARREQPQRPVITAPIPDAAMRGLTARIGMPMPAGNEGAGTVVAAGSSEAAQRLLGKKVAAAGGAMYSQYRTVDLSLCLELPEGLSAADGASAFVNPMTALGMIETMRMEDHVALVHTAAASNLGQMLNRLCQEEQVPLVNIVRRPEQEELLRAAGAAFVCDSSKPEFMNELTAALTATGATLAFDATGGGMLASQILTCMEAIGQRQRGQLQPVRVGGA